MSEPKCFSGLVDYNKKKKHGKATHTSLPVWKTALYPHVAIIFQTCRGSDGMQQSVFSCVLARSSTSHWECAKFSHGMLLDVA